MPRSATGTPEIHIFVPFRPKPPSVSTAVDFIEATSEPVLGSVMAKHPSKSALINLGIQRSRCSSVPKLRRTDWIEFIWRLKGSPQDGEILATSSVIKK